MGYGPAMLLDSVNALQLLTPGAINENATQGSGDPTFGTPVARPEAGGSSLLATGAWRLAHGACIHEWVLTSVVISPKWPAATNYCETQFYCLICMPG